jgi:hypothetical protein
MKFALAEALLMWIVVNWHYVPGDPLAEIIRRFLDDRARMESRPCPPSG